jgi:hypothetical protein
LSSNGLDPAVFNLTSLRRLDLSMNNFAGQQDEDISLLLDSRVNSPNINLHSPSLTHLI